MKISIVTISYNQARFLEQTILSVIKQDYPDIEYIVVDAGSTDGSRDIIKKYENHINQIIFEPDNGPADGLNKGFLISTGEIFGFLNSDDILFPGAITAVINQFEKNPLADVISGHGYLIDENGSKIKKLYSDPFSLIEALHGASVLVQQSTFYRRKVIELVGGFNIENRISWDGELWDDIAAAGGKFFRIHSVLSGFRSHSSSITNSQKYIEGLRNEQNRIAKKLGVSKRKNISRLFWLKSRLLDPYVSFMKIIDRLIEIIAWRKHLNNRKPKHPTKNIN